MSQREPQSPELAILQIWTDLGAWVSESRYVGLEITEMHRIHTNEVRKNTKKRGKNSRYYGTRGSWGHGRHGFGMVLGWVWRGVGMAERWIHCGILDGQFNAR